MSQSVSERQHESQESVYCLSKTKITPGTFLGADSSACALLQFWYMSHPKPGINRAELLDSRRDAAAN